MGLVGGGVLIALLELLGVSALAPLMILIYQPEVAIQHPFLRPLFLFLGFQDPKWMICLLGAGVGGVFVLKGVIQVIYLRFSLQTIAKWRDRVLDLFYATYLQAPYEVHLARSSASMHAILSSAVFGNASVFLQSCVSFFTLGLTGLLLLGFLFYLYTTTSLIVLVLGGGLLWGHTFFLGRLVKRLGSEKLTAAEEQFAVMHQGLAGYKDVQIYLKIPFFERLFHHATARLSQVTQKELFYQTLPSISIELLVLIIIIGVFEFTLLTQNTPGAAFIQIGTFALITFRCLPVINRLISALAQIHSTQEPVMSLLEEGQALDLSATQPLSVASPKPLPFQKELLLKSASYTYPKTGEPALKDMTFSLKPGEFIGLTGPSGGGKTTLVNILLGFLTPQRGSFTLDGTPLTPDNRDGFRMLLGYVDQKIFILNGSVAQNVAFGVSSDQIDSGRVQRALQRAQLWDFVEGLPEGIDTMVGEHGKRLSGGQQQRLAIARALYRDVQILILDEASAALDVGTEKRFFEFLATLKGELTVIMIAHRLTTLKDCDRVLFMDHGELKGMGNFTELAENCAAFKEYLEFSELGGVQVHKTS